jgi:hypothetical protein
MPKIHRKFMSPYFKVWAFCVRLAYQTNTMKSITLSRIDLINLLSHCERSINFMEDQAESDRLHTKAAYQPEIDAAKDLQARLQEAYDEDCIFTSRKVIR